MYLCIHTVSLVGLIVGVTVGALVISLCCPLCIILSILACVFFVFRRQKRIERELRSNQTRREGRSDESAARLQPLRTDHYLQYYCSFLQIIIIVVLGVQT